MEAPPIEQFTRLLLALVMTGAFILLSAMTRLVWDRPARWVTLFMAVILGVYTAWRWFLLWLGAQSADEPRSQMATYTVIGNVLLIAVILAVVCMAYHHVRELRKGRTP